MPATLVTLCLLLAQVSRDDVALDFDTQIMPILSVAGCNTASCHGAAKGQADFQLSLFGGDPEHDYRSIVRQLEGRRINLHQPAESLLLRKATEEMEHGGEQRFSLDSPSAQRLQHWIAQGAPRLQSRRLVELHVHPESITLDGPAQIEPLRVTASFSDGTAHDVSAWSTYWTSDESALRRNDVGGYQLTRPGRYWLFVRFLSQIVTVPVSAPVGTQPILARDMDRNNWIDDRVNTSLAELRLSPAPRADDPTLVRRLYLDLTGRFPTPDQLASFLNDTSPHKRTELIDRLIDSDAFTDYWTYRLGQWLRFQLPGGDREAAERFYSWLRRQVAEDRGWDQIARDLLMAEGDSHEYGPASFHRLVADPRQQAEYVSEVMLGVRLRCANCHNHPLDRWTQDDYHGLAQVFAAVKRGRIVSRADAGFVIHPRTGQPAAARIPGQGPLPVPSDAIAELTDWLVSPDNPYFAQAMVGRIWRTLMGRGLIDPVDDTRTTNPPSDSALLQALSREFATTGFRWRHTIRAICESAAYQRSGVATHADPANEQFYVTALRRPLSAEVLADAITDVTGVSDGGADGVRTIQLLEPGASAETLRVLGRCDFTAGCLPENYPSRRGVATRLELINGPVLNARIESAAGHVQQLLGEQHSREDVVSTLYQLALSRSPTDDELRHWCHELESAADLNDQHQRLEDFVWSLLNCQDFVTNH